MQANALLFILNSLFGGGKVNGHIEMNITCTIPRGEIVNSSITSMQTKWAIIIYTYLNTPSSIYDVCDDDDDQEGEKKSP